MKKPKVTVIIPAYNAEKYVGRCLDSVLAQTFQDFEVLVINDGSKDKTGKIIQKYAKKYEQIYYAEQNNMGPARTRNKAIKESRGEFIAFIDCDDFIDEDYLEKLLPLEDEEVVISGYRRPNKEGKTITEVRLEDTYWSRFLVVAPWAKVYKKDFIVKNDLEFLDNDIGEDVYFSILAALMAKKVRILDYVGYNWFYNDKSISNTKHKKYEDSDIFTLFNSCYDELLRRKLLRANYKWIEFYYYRFIVWFLLHAAKGAKKKEINKIYDELFGWLGEKFPDYKKNSLLENGPAGETKTSKFVCKIFMKFHKMGLGKLLVWAYAKI